METVSVWVTQSRYSVSGEQELVKGGVGARVGGAEGGGRLGHHCLGTSPQGQGSHRPPAGNLPGEDSALVPIGISRAAACARRHHWEEPGSVSAASQQILQKIWVVLGSCTKELIPSGVVATDNERLGAAGRGRLSERCSSSGYFSVYDPPRQQRQERFAGVGNKEAFVPALCLGCALDISWKPDRLTSLEVCEHNGCAASSSAQSRGSGRGSTGNESVPKGCAGGGSARAALSRRKTRVKSAQTLAAPWEVLQERPMWSTLGEFLPNSSTQQPPLPPRHIPLSPGQKDPVLRVTEGKSLQTQRGTCHGIPGCKKEALRWTLS
ncbi:uncharacterized protein LOC128917138 [Rissa tridactyla]|uniref:uncharacterized protein LOC128917138 n=1 Tax=Rissa tridactyla TaxID=75485 RepID=UPI0023BAB096|nr:uncharacterized protein LOC128917138 [Rissa tridactyla]